MAGQFKALVTLFLAFWRVACILGAINTPERPENPTKLHGRPRLFLRKYEDYMEQMFRQIQCQDPHFYRYRDKNIFRVINYNMEHFLNLGVGEGVSDIYYAIFDAYREVMVYPTFTDSTRVEIKTPQNALKLPVDEKSIPLIINSMTSRAWKMLKMVVLHQPSVLILHSVPEGLIKFCEHALIEEYRLVRMVRIPFHHNKLYKFRTLVFAEKSLTLAQSEEGLDPIVMSTLMLKTPNKQIVCVNTAHIFGPSPETGRPLTNKLATLELELPKAIVLLGGEFPFDPAGTGALEASEEAGMDSMFDQLLMPEPQLSSTQGVVSTFILGNRVAARRLQRIQFLPNLLGNHMPLIADFNLEETNQVLPKDKPQKSPCHCKRLRNGPVYAYPDNDA